MTHTNHSKKVSESQSPTKQVIVSKQPGKSILPIPLKEALVFDLIDTNSEESSLKGIFDETPILNTGQRDRLIRNSNTKAQLLGGNNILQEMQRRQEMTHRSASNTS